MTTRAATLLSVLLRVWIASTLALPLTLTLAIALVLILITLYLLLIMLLAVLRLIPSTTERRLVGVTSALTSGCVVRSFATIPWASASSPLRITSTSRRTTLSPVLCMVDADEASVEPGLSVS